MVAFCLGQLSLCAEGLGSERQAVELQLQAMLEIEWMRAPQSRPKWQQEYRHRFDTVYRAALLTMLRTNEPAGFTAVFESLWGRRLSGLSDGVVLDPAEDPVLLAQLLTQNEQARRRGYPSGPDDSKGDRVTKLLGRFALSDALPDRYARATDQVLAGAFRPMAEGEAADLLASLPDDQAVLLTCELPGVPRTLAWLFKLPHAEPT